MFGAPQRENAKSLDSRDDDLLSKQKDLLALRASNRTLENFKMVMDHRLQQLMAERGRRAALTH